MLGSVWSTLDNDDDDDDDGVSDVVRCFNTGRCRLHDCYHRVNDASLPRKLYRTRFFSFIFFSSIRSALNRTVTVKTIS